MSDFTAQDYRQLSEAIESYEDAWKELGMEEAGQIAVVLDAARRFRDRYQICQTCDGKGWEYEGNLWMTPDDYPDNATTRCPDCVGGLVPNQERLEQMARTEYEGDETGWWEMLSDRGREIRLKQAAVAVRAFDKEPT